MAKAKAAAKAAKPTEATKVVASGNPVLPVPIRQADGLIIFNRGRAFIGSRAKKS